MIAEAAVAKAFAGWTPNRPPLTHREFAKRTLLPGGPLKGTAYDPATDPVQSWLCDQLDSDAWESLTWAAPPQIAGKTQLMIVVPALRAAIDMCETVGYGLPTLHDLDRGWQTKVGKAFRDAGFGAYLPQKGPGSKGGRPPAVTFEDPNNNRAPLGGLIFLAGGAKQVTGRVICLDELDAWRNADGTPRWNDIEDAWARADSFQGDAIRIGTGTLECDDPARSILLPLINERGTGTRPHLRCPHCGAHAPASFDQFTYEHRTTDGGPDLEHARATAAYVCPSCATRWTEDDRRKALLAGVFAHKGQTVDAAGIVQGPAPSTRHLGLRTTALDCILTTMAAIAERLAMARHALEAHGNHDPMRKFWRYQRVECYTGDQQQDEDAKDTPHTHRSLAARSERTAWAEVVENADDGKLWSRYTAAPPDSVQKIVAAIDVQRNRLYWTLTGIADDRRTWDIGWGIERARAGQDGKEPPPWSTGELTETLTRTADWLEEYTGALFAAGVVDVGDGQTVDEIARWLAHRKGWHAIQGEDHLPKPRPDGSITHRSSCLAWDSKWRPGLGSYRVLTELAQQQVAGAYKIDPTAPGAALLPGPLKPGNTYLRHLTAVGWIKPGKWGSLPGGGRWDYMDARCYGTAVALWLIAKPPPSGPAPPIDLPILHLGGLSL